MIYVAYQDIFGVAGIIFEKFKSSEEAHVYIKNHHQDLHVEKLTQEQYEKILKKDGYFDSQDLK